MSSIEEKEMWKTGDILVFARHVRIVISDPFYPEECMQPSIICLEPDGRVLELCAEKKFWWAYREFNQ